MMILLSTRLPNANTFGLPEVAVPSRATRTTRVFCLMDFCDDKLLQCIFFGDFWLAEIENCCLIHEVPTN